MDKRKNDTSKITAEDLRQCTNTLEALINEPLLLNALSEEDKLRFFLAAGQAIRPDRNRVRRQVKMLRRSKTAERREAHKTLRATTTIRVTRTDSVFIAPARQLADGNHTKTFVRELETPDTCYICKTDFTKVHHFYDALCPTCAEFNYEKRFQTFPLAGRVALITGARLKIGYQAALMLLRAGARVIVTTRFPIDAAIRYAKEMDFTSWKDRLQVYGLDLRHSPSVETFTQYINHKYDRLDFLINNAAQTVRRPPGFYSHMMESEKALTNDLPAGAQLLLQEYEACKQTLTQHALDYAGDGTTWVSEWHQGAKDRSGATLGITASAALSQIPYACDDASTMSQALFPEGRLDADLQQVDLRKMNSWRMKLADVPTAELLEVQLVNSIAPFILCSKLKPLMLRDNTGDKHVVNVSAMEGKFARHTKTDKHPHTNMAKAALNMMTLTSAKDYVVDGIFMNAVDTGWVTDEDPAELASRKQKDHDFQPPLDIVDGAARILDPIFAGLRCGQHSWGKFLKDYMPTEW